jgi:hypothetical protein
MKTHPGLPNVNARITFAKHVTVAEHSNDRDRVEPSVLGERRRDDLKVLKSGHTVGGESGGKLCYMILIMDDDKSGHTIRGGW